jgi:alpha-N-arabinofuranosidase
MFTSAFRRFPLFSARAAVARRLALAGLSLGLALRGAAAEPGVAVLLVDTDRVEGKIDERIHGQFLEHINHSVEDGLYAEQVRGQGFEGKDFEDYWQPFADAGGKAEPVAVKFEGGERSVRLTAAGGGTAGLRQGRVYVEAGTAYDGSVWLNPEQGTLRFGLRLTNAAGRVLAETALAPKAGTGWQEVAFKLTAAATERDAVLEIFATGTGAALLDFPSLMRASARASGKFRPDLLESLRALRPPFIRWPGGSFASTYKWQDGIGPAVGRKFTPNLEWGGYSDYYGFGTDEFMELCRQLGSEPMIVLAANSLDPAQLDYAMNWLHYLLDPPTTEWGRRRAANGHPEPYRVPYIQIDNEPMNLGLSPDAYAAIVNLYAPRIRALAPGAKIVACGQKRSNDMQWTQKLVDLAGANFDILGCHNYEYEPENFATGVRRIEDYLEKAAAYIRASAHPGVRLAVLEWNLARTYDWRAGLHAAGSLISYEKLSPALDMSCPALLMRNTTDNPEWRAWIYHDHVSWFAGSGYVAQKLFRDHYAPVRLASASGTFRDQADRAAFFSNISQMKPERWRPDTVDALATASDDGRRLVLKAVNYDSVRHILLTRVQGARAPAAANVKIWTIAASLNDENSLAEPNKIRPVERTATYAPDMAFELPPYAVMVVEITAQ